MEDESGNVDYAIRNETFKYIDFSKGEDALYNLIEDPLETVNLLNTALSDTENSNKLALQAEIIRIKQ